VTDPIDSLMAALARTGPGSSDFDLNPGTILPEGRRLRPAGVLVPVTLAHGAPRVILTKRSSALKHHPGQIAFPGGKQDEGDADVIAAALREAYADDLMWLAAGADGLAWLMDDPNKKPAGQTLPRPELTRGRRNEQDRRLAGAG